MKRFAAFLRGMNLGKRRITNDELCAAFEDLGFDEVTAFLASGNVVFETKRRANTLERAIATGLEDALGYAVPTFVRSADEIRAIAQRTPFSKPVLAKSAGKLQVVLLPKAPTAAARKRVLALATDDDRLAFDGRELYWLPVGNLSDSELSMATIEKATGGLTVRTKRTLDRMAAKFFGD